MDRRVKLVQAKSLVLLATALVMTVTWAVGATGWTHSMNIITLVGFGSVVIGLMLARSILPGLIAHLFSIIIGISWSFWITSRLLPTDYTWLERWQELTSRLSNWYIQAIQGGTSYDNLMFILQMGIIIWGMGYLTIWFIFRSGWVWLAMLPGGIVLLINLYYAPNDITGWFLLFILLALLLAIRSNLLQQELKWRQAGVFFRPDMTFDFLRDGFIFSILVITLAWKLPLPAESQSFGPVEEVQGAWSDLQENWNRLFADLNYKVSDQIGSFGSSLSLGGPRRLTNEPVMNVKIEGPGRYWRAAVYDEYTGFGWRNTDSETARLEPGTPLSLPIFEARTPVTQTYTFYSDQTYALYAMGQPINLDRPARVTFTTLNNQQITGDNFPMEANQGEPWVEEITYIRSYVPLRRGESYQVVSVASLATVSQLEAAGNAYPNWITARYLQLPDTITERTRHLAFNLTQSDHNAFDRAQTIENYLRHEIKYNEKIPAPPPNVEKVDYILFEAKEAYCDYYASAMIVMLRSLGIPARLAAGFAQGTFDPKTGVYQVLNADAHSWVEVYFPQYGWIEFEPTASQPTLIRPTGSTNTAEGSPEASPSPGETPERNQLSQHAQDLLEDDDNTAPGLALTLPWVGASITVPKPVMIVGSIGVGGIIVAGLVIGLLGWRQLIKQVGDIFPLYRRMLRLASWMGQAIRPWQTPYEHAAVLQRRIPNRQDEIEIITETYVHQLFSLSPSPQIDESNQAWRRLYPAMLKAAFKRRLPKWLRI